MSIRSEIDRISVAKSAIKSAIEASGVSVPDGTKLDGYPALTSSILGQFSDELDTIIGGDTTPVTDITARLATVNGVSGDVNAQLDTLDGTKSAIKDAIIAKGVEVPDGTTFYEYAGKIESIETGAPIETVNFTFEAYRRSGTLAYLDGSGGYKTASSGSGVVLQVEKNTIVSLISSAIDSYGGDIETIGGSSSFFVYGDCTLATY